MPKYLRFVLFFAAALLLLPLQAGSKASKSSTTTSTKIIDFASCSQNYQCYLNRFTEELSQRGIKATLTDLKKYSAENQTVRTYCHSMAHALGRAAYSQTGGNIGRVFSEGDTTCWSGFYHGALEKAFSGSKDLAATAQSLCTSGNGVKGNFLYYQCLHGLGHGLSVRFDNEIYQALAVCEKLIDSYQQNSCYGGVFMENYVANPITGHVSKYLDSNDPIAPCNQVAEKFKYNCYQLVSIQILKLNNYDFGAAFTTCEQADINYIDVCYQSVGRDASGFTAENPDQALALCYQGNFRAQRECVKAVASDSVYSKSSVDYVAITCQKAKVELKNTCYEAVGGSITVLYDSLDQRARACEKMEAGYVEICKKAAGVT